MCICLICQTTIAIPKKGNVERHFRTVRKKDNTDFPPKSELRKRKVRELKSRLTRQQSFFTQWNSQAKADTETLLRVSHSIIKHKKSFQDGEMVKEACVEAADSFFWDFKNKIEILSSIKALQLSRSKVTQLCEIMAEDLTQEIEVHSVCLCKKRESIMWVFKPYKLKKPILTSRLILFSLQDWVCNFYSLLKTLFGCFL